MDHPPLLRSSRMLLRPLEVQDRGEFVRVQQLGDENYRQWFPLPEEGQTPDSLFDAQLARSIRGRADGTEFRFVGFLADGRIAGFFNLFQIVRGAFQNAGASWSVSADLCGQGLATEGVTALLDFAFAPSPAGLSLHRVGAAVIPTNLASLRVAEKNGFRREGLGQKYLKINGQWQDHVLLAKLAEEHGLPSLRTGSRVDVR